MTLLAPPVVGGGAPAKGTNPPTSSRAGHNPSR
jgi:hypothetical protein